MAYSQEDGNSEFNKKIRLYGFYHKNHLIRSLKKYLGESYDNSEEIPEAKIIECQQKRLQSKT